MNRPDTALAGSSAIVRLADHAHEKYQRDIQDCDESIARRAGLDYIAHITSGIWDFSVHFPAPELRSESFEKAARQLSLIVARIDATADQLDSGPLIRVVVQGNHGALFHMLKVAGQNFFAVTMDGARETVNKADRALAQIVDSAARRVGSPSLLWGGYRNRQGTGDLWLPGATVLLDEYPVRSASAAGLQPVPEEVARRCRDVLDVNEIHFLAIYRHDTLVWRADLFADRALASFFQRATPASRRRGYDKVIRQVTMQTGRIMQLLALVRSDVLTRLVLDVARGAIYVLPLGDREHYLVGVTLVQAQVANADSKMTALHDELATVYCPGGSLA